MTFWESLNNYGQLLQAYALQTYLQKKGHEVFLIKYYRVSEFEFKSLFYRFKSFIKKRIPSKRQIKSNKREHEFLLFKKKYINFSKNSYYSLQEIQKNPPKADVYICGSDQVWNNSFKVKCHPFLLGFGDSRIIRISYAASFGKKNLNPQTMNLFKENIGRFDGVSVREKSGIKICEDAGYSNAVWVPDPTLLFNKNEWRENLSIESISSKENKNKIFIYTLGNSHINNKQEILDYAYMLPDTDICHASANNDPTGDSYPGIRDWVKNITEADFVITNSFHGMVFCIIFNKNFVVLPNTGEVQGMNERITSLLDKLQLEGHIMHEFSKSHMNELRTKVVNWENVSTIINSWKKEADEFLTKSFAKQVLKNGDSVLSSIK